MFKRLSLVLLVFLLMSGVAMAGPVATTKIMDTTFNAVTTSDDSDEVNIQGYDKVSFFVVYNESQVGNNVSATVRLEISYDGTNYSDAQFFDFTGGSTLQTEEIITADKDYLFWLDKDLSIPYARVKVIAGNTDADDLLDVDVYMVAKE